MNNYRRLGLALGLALILCTCGGDGSSGAVPSTGTSIGAWDGSQWDRVIWGP